MRDRVLVVLSALICAGGLPVVVLAADRGLLFTGLAVVAIGLVAYALTFIIRPPSSTRRRRGMGVAD